MATKGRKTVISSDDQKIGGFNVYRDEKGRPVYLNRLNHTGYVLSDRTKPFRTLSSRFYIGGVAGIFAFMFELPIWVCIAIAVISCGVMEYKFRKFLTTLPQIPNFKPSESTSRIAAEAALDTNKIVTKIVLFFLLAILVVINAYDHKFEGVVLALNWVVAIFACGLGINEIRALLLHNK